MEHVFLDLRYAARILRRNLGFSAVTILTLALGIGVTTSIFTVVNGVLLQPLPYPEPDRLVMLWEMERTGNSLQPVAPANFVDWREESHSFIGIAAIDPFRDFVLSNGGEPPVYLAGAAAGADLFKLLGVRMALGRSFLPDEDRSGEDQVVILSYNTWQRYFGAQPDVLGKQITLNNSSYTVVGVLPREFNFVSKASDFQSRNQFEIWTPLGLPSTLPPWQRGTHPLRVIARLKPGISLDSAQADLNGVARDLQRLYPDYNTNRDIKVVPIREQVVANSRLALLTLLAAVGMLLLIACANIANLFLARATARQREMAVRVALGASPKRVSQQLLTESIMLAVIGGALGLFLTIISVPTIVHLLPADLPRKSTVSVDGQVLTFTTFISLLTGLLFGLAPLIQSLRLSTNDALKSGGRGVVTGQSQVQSVLIIGQVAIALVLVIGAGLMTKSFWTLSEVSPGFRTEYILTARLSFPPQYSDSVRRASFQNQMLERLRNIPGVQSAAFTTYLPLSGTYNAWSFKIERRPPKPPGIRDMAEYRPVSVDYFKTMGIPVLRGRVFDSGDRSESPPVVVISESMVRDFWKNENPIGQQISFGQLKWRVIVGVVGDVRHEALGAMPKPTMYVPYTQIPSAESQNTIVLHTAVDPKALVNSLRATVVGLGAEVPIDHIETMKQVMSTSIGNSRFRTALLLTFGVLALLVASIGLYGVMSYLVNQRTNEFGVRMALGASTSSILLLVLSRSAKFVSIGICLGLLGALLLGRLTISLLYGVKPFDITIFAGGSAIFAIVALAASYFPARRAAKIDPIVSLRQE